MKTRDLWCSVNILLIHTLLINNFIELSPYQLAAPASTFHEQALRLLNNGRIELVYMNFSFLFSDEDFLKLCPKNIVSDYQKFWVNPASYREKWLKRKNFGS